LDLALNIAALFGVIIVLWIILFVPVPGLNGETEITVIDESYNVKFLESSTLPEGDHSGSHNIMTGEIRIATGWKPTYSFMSTCSHEVQHLKFEIMDENRDSFLTTEEEHQRMHGLGSKLLPWNWEHECLGLLDNRFNLG
jgi:hypothetical protein